MARVTRDKDEKRLVDGEVYLGDGFSIEFPDDKKQKIMDFLEEYNIVKILEIANYDDLVSSSHFNEEIEEIIMNSKALSNDMKEAFLKL